MRKYHEASYIKNTLNNTVPQQPQGQDRECPKQFLFQIVFKLFFCLLRSFQFAMPMLYHQAFCNEKIPGNTTCIENSCMANKTREY